MSGLIPTELICSNSIKHILLVGPSACGKTYEKNIILAKNKIIDRSQAIAKTRTYKEKYIYRYLYRKNAALVNRDAYTVIADNLTSDINDFLSIIEEIIFRKSDNDSSSSARRLFVARAFINKIEENIKISTLYNWEKPIIEDESLLQKTYMMLCEFSSKRALLSDIDRIFSLNPDIFLMKEGATFFCYRSAIDEYLSYIELRHIKTGRRRHFHIDTNKLSDSYLAHHEILMHTYKKMNELNGNVFLFDFSKSKQSG